VDFIVEWMHEYVSGAGADGLVIGLSGGVDSATSAALAVRAMGREHVLGVLLPCHSVPEDARLGQEVADSLSIETVTVDLIVPFDALIDVLPKSDHHLAVANIKPRLRMTVSYYLAQVHNYLVLGSGNKTEIAVGYATKYGDAGADLFPLGDLYKTQVWELARELNVPEAVVNRTPTGGLWPGQTDEGEMGITYAELDRVLMAIERGEVSHVDSDTLDKVQGMVAKAAHKRVLPPVCRLS